MLEAIIARNPAEKIYVEDVFSTYLHTGTGASQTINNGINLLATSEWSTFKVNSTTENNGIAVDSLGNTYVAGQALTKYNSSGVFQWSRRLFLSPYYTTISGVVVGANDDVYVSGTIFDSNAQCFAVAKFNSSGTLQWQKVLQSASVAGSYAYDIAIDSSDNVYACGYFVDTNNFSYGYFAKFNSAGTVQFQRTFRESSGLSSGNGITVDSSGNIYVSGQITNTFLISKWDSTGSLTWSRKVADTTASASNARKPVVDSSGNVYVAGHATRSAERQALLAKYNSSGTLQWQRKLYHTTSETLNFASGIVIDSNDYINIVGTFTDGTNSYPLWARYNSSGTLLNQYRLFLSGTDATSFRIIKDASTNLYIGTTSGNPYVTKLNGASTSFGGSAFYGIVPGSATEAAGTATDSATTINSGSAPYTFSASLTNETVTYTITSYTQAQSISNGGLVWVKDRDVGNAHILQDTLQGTGFYLRSASTAAATARSDLITSFNSNGFTVGVDASLWGVNKSPDKYVSWTFKRTPKFFDVVTWTGDNTTSRSLNHSLGVLPGLIIVKKTNSTGNWYVVCRYNSTLYGYGDTNTGVAQFVLNSTGYVQTTATFATTATISTIDIAKIVDDHTNNTGTYPTGFNHLETNASGNTYIAYLFAHDTSTDGMIQSGTFTTDGAGAATVNLGWEPQWILFKPISATGDWWISDNMRGLGVGSTPILRTNTNAAEQSTNNNTINATGFSVSVAASTTYTYMAIRRDPMRVPTDATKVFNPLVRTGTGSATSVTTGGFAPDLVSFFERGATQSANKHWQDKLRGVGNSILSTSSNAETAVYTDALIEFLNNGFRIGADGSNQINYSGSSYINLLFRRAPQFFDIVCYTGNGNTAQILNHNLKVKPQLMIAKNRSSTVDWACTVTVDSPFNYASLKFNRNTATDGLFNIGGGTETTFGVGGNFNNNSANYVAYLFGNCAGVSKIGAYVGNGTSQNISCGFSGGARFVMIKRTDDIGDWFIWDSSRGIVTGNDPYLAFNNANGENYFGAFDDIDPLTGGFTVNSTSNSYNINVNNANYIYLAIA